MATNPRSPNPTAAAFEALMREGVVIRERSTESEGVIQEGVKVIPEGGTVRQPETSEGGWPKKLRTLTAAELDRLTIDKNGRLFWDGRAVNYEAVVNYEGQSASGGGPTRESAMEGIERAARVLKSMPTPVELSPDALAAIKEIVSNQESNAMEHLNDERTASVIARALGLYRFLVREVKTGSEVLLKKNKKMRRIFIE